MCDLHNPPLGEGWGEGFSTPRSGMIVSTMIPSAGQFRNNTTQPLGAVLIDERWDACHEVCVLYPAHQMEDLIDASAPSEDGA